MGGADLEDATTDPPLRPASPHTLLVTSISRTLASMAVILVVDDDAVLRQVAARILEADGHEVFRAHGGFVALMICQEREGAIDLLVINERLADMAGWELFRLAQSTQPQARVVYLAGGTETEPSHATLRRPFTADELLAEVHKHVARSRSREA